ncbi:sigma-54-dependent transcriptional regulator [Candidatus Liberibacter americanus]|uniref:Two component response regulator nitrogen assimilation regulatory protein n=1 Tax=Candidatus Liberibacter americanus str. Sao Paulo TaxID=1261131 RepID=U6B5K4_9HYPH|nr:sigma-54 dependent transcriptional regulator [Candidatus Liberibacter americanus]AHA28300.1 two component response regulator nitrogen assimilation regulatory protein [Candidatus Liberibacter americanus str. Sao Paulo]EMS36592.1 two-component response regulator nitrogen regulation protein [Candidatus Liberibacter americanus PW_SP]
MKYDVLIVDGKKNICNLISSSLEDNGYSTIIAQSMDNAIEEINKFMPRLVFLDIDLIVYPEKNFSFFNKIKDIYPEILFVVTSYSDHLELAIAAIKHGAFDFIEKPFNTDQALLIVNRAIGNSRFKVFNENKEEIEEELIGGSAPIVHLRQSIDRIASTNSRVMIFGSSGSGKKFIARFIHNKSARSQGEFIFFDAPNIPPDFMEIALFGMDNPAGEPQRIGYLEMARHGTIYINEIADIPCSVQDRILRALLQQEFKRVNGVKSIPLDVRIISSTAVNPNNYIVKGLLREDLYYRLAVVLIRVPGLIERKEDIPIIAENLICRISHKSGLHPRHISDDAMAFLQAYDWPGNILELKKYLENIIFSMRDKDPRLEVTIDMLPSNLGKFLPTATVQHGDQVMNLSLREAREVFEKNYITAQINRFGGNISRTAEFIGMERSALHRKIKSLGI